MSGVARRIGHWAWTSLVTIGLVLGLISHQRAAESRSPSNVNSAIPSPVTPDEASLINREGRDVGQNNSALR